jgi:hypothetical protein
MHNRTQQSCNAVTAGDWDASPVLGGRTVGDGTRWWMVMGWGERWSEDRPAVLTLQTRKILNPAMWHQWLHRENTRHDAADPIQSGKIRAAIERAKFDLLYLICSGLTQKQTGC